MSSIITIPLGFANSFIVKDRGIILVDTGINANKEKFTQFFQHQKIDPRQISLIIITHGHADHFGHANYLKALTGAPILCHAEAVSALQAGNTADVTPRNELGKRVLKLVKLPVSVAPIQPDLIINSSFELAPYGVAGKIIPTPGHSNCSLSVILESGDAIVGDILVASPFSGEPCLAYFASDEKALYESVKILAEVAHTFHSGHGGPFTREVVLKLLESS